LHEADTAEFRVAAMKLNSPGKLSARAQTSQEDQRNN